MTLPETKMKVSLLCKINFAILICFCESALTPEIKKVYHGLLSGKGLYNEEDGIVILNKSNFKAKLYDTNNAWLIEFYNSWCGHCHKFAPVWKTLAADLFEWKKVVKLAAIDCAHDGHTSICRDYDIMAYPTIKFFPARSSLSSLGTEVSIISHSEKEITKTIVKILQNEQLEGRGSHWPNVVPCRSLDSLNQMTENNEIQYVFLMFADTNDSIAVEVILDLSNVKGIEIRYVVPENEVFSKFFGVAKFPSLIVIERSKNKPKFLQTKDASREAFRSAIKAFLIEKGFAVPEEPRMVKVISPNEMPSLKELQAAMDSLIHIKKIKELGDVVFLMDLENTLKYSLQHEISSRKNISGESFRALNNYLGVLAKYFPTGEAGAHYLQKLRDKVFSETEITGVAFKAYLNNLAKGGLESIFLSRYQWMGCRGSESSYRGYPCGLWTLFHYMTVNALHDSGEPHFDPIEVLNAMVGYITNFFGCTQCSKHFEQMAINRSLKVTSAKDAVIWLWAAHNEVNKRLAQDKSEDPEFPKIQFPFNGRCPNCRFPNGSWNEPNVLNYLIFMYNQDNLNLMSSDKKLYVSNRSNVETYVSKSQMYGSSGQKKITKDFNVFDISLCVLLYILSGVICIAVCLKFVLKKRHKKKAPALDLFGRV